MQRRPRHTQLRIPFGKPGKKRARRKGLSRAEIRELKEEALKLAKQAYAVGKSERWPRGERPEHIERWLREIGKDIGDLKSGKATATEAKNIIGRTKDFLDMCGKKVD